MPEIKYPTGIVGPGGTLTRPWCSELNGLRNIIKTSEEDNMNDRDYRSVKQQMAAAGCLNGAKISYATYDEGECCEGPSPESPKETLKALRKQAKRIREEIAAVKKQAKRNAKHKAQAEAAAIADARRLREDIATARAALHRVANDTSKGYAAVEAARSLLNLTQEG